MPDGDKNRGHVAGITKKLEIGDSLNADDVTFILGYVPTTSDYGELEVYRDEIDDAITGEVGHAAYVKILQEFETVGIIDGLRVDLVDPSLDPDGFERIEVGDKTRYRGVMIEKKASEGVGWVHPPDKRPTSLSRLRDSVFDYLFCTGWGFHLDAEMIYEYEVDYREFLRAVIDCADGLDDYRLSVDADDSGRRTTISVTLRSDGRSYSKEFEHGSDWLRFDALDPVQTALDQQTLQTVHYKGGNDGWILLVDDEYEERVMTHLPEWRS